jgi:very-short-patch-repair endonuclease
MIHRKYSKNLSTKFRLAKSFRQKMTPSEELLWSRFRGNQLLGLHFRRQHVIRGFIVDFYCHRTRLVVEIDGDIHKSQTETDAFRDEIIDSLGLSMLRLSNDKVEKNLGGAIREIQIICQEYFPDIQKDSVG